MEVLEKADIEQLAVEQCVAIALVEGRRELSAINNNSICSTLNPDGVYVGKCAAYCGAASGEVARAGGAVSYKCHAGLECRAMPIAPGTVAVVGRAFTKPEDYRSATNRAIGGSWSRYSQGDLLANLLLCESSAVVDEAARKVAAMQLDVPDAPPMPEPKQEVPAPPRKRAAGNGIPERNEGPGEQKKGGPSKWRSFFGSLLKADHAAARVSMLEFIGKHYGFAGLMWLERVDADLVGTDAIGDMGGRKLKLDIAADDTRLTEAAHNEMPLELQEKGDSDRKLYLFPIGVAGEVSAAVATLDAIDSDTTKHQVARICLSVASQFEILKLRTEMKRRERISGAVRRIGENIKNIDADDFWMQLTQNTAEMLEAERASLMIYDERSEEFEVKAMIGARNKFDPHSGNGDRVAKFVVARGTAALVDNMSGTGLGPTPEDRRYKMQSFLSCPISIGNRTIGVMSFTDRASGKPFDKASLELYDAIAPQLAVAVDRARLKEKAGEFEQLSVTDALTGLLNRRYIEQRLNEEVKRSNRHGFPMSFMMLDVDHFKSYNDEFGHPAGDEALKLVGSVIRDTLRAADVAARFGGEEFAILLPQTMPDEAAVIAERIRGNVEKAKFPHRPVTMSIGVASCSAELCSSQNIVSAADKSLYEAKRGGRNRVRTFEEMGATQIGDQ